MKKLLSALVLGLGLSACPSEYEGPCRTNADCVTAPADLCDQTLALSCVSGECVESCETDADCREDPLEATERRDCGGVNPNRFRVCSQLRCTPGCLPEGATGEGIQCPAGQSCAPDGRCALFTESFEPPMGETSISLPVLRQLCRAGGSDPNTCSKWDDLPRPKLNTESRISFSGLLGCDRTAFGAEDICAGPAADGLFFLRLERVPAAGAGGVFDYTCAACKCCAECLDGRHRQDQAAECLGTAIPTIPRACTNPNEPACASVCAECTQCPAVPAGENQRPVTEEATGLSSCEVVAAARICPGWLSAENCRTNARAGACSAQCPNPTETPPACDECLRGACMAEDREYRACELAEKARMDCPTCPDIWGPLQDLCDSQGGLACAKGAVFVNRTELTEDEQALVSPILNLQGQAGDLRLSFQYIPFRIGAQFFTPVGDPPVLQSVAQEVAVAFCGGGCEDDQNWVDSGRALPTLDERNNGLSAGDHGALDWSVYHFEVGIPDAVRTAGFRFRLLPRLADDAVLGVDNVIVRIKQ